MMMSCIELHFICWRGFTIANLGFCLLKVEWYLGRYRICFELSFALHA
jgi:hypothetical protein